MTDASSAPGSSIGPGRIVGALILVQMAGSVLVNFVLTRPLFGEPGFLVGAATHAQQIGLSALLGLTLGAAFVAIAITAFPIFWQCSQRMALWLLALSVGGFAVGAVEHMGVMSMVSLSEAYARSGPAEHAQFEALRIVVASARNWAHFTARVADGAVLLVFYALLYRCRLIPRALAAFGLIAVVLQLAAVAMPFLGHGVVFPLLAPIGLSQLALALWLIVRGFRVPARLPS